MLYLKWIFGVAVQRINTPPCAGYFGKEEMEIIIKFWTELGWLANFLTILLGLITIYGIYIKIKSWLDSKKYKNTPHADMQSFVYYKKNNQNNLRSKRIAIVDDQPENYPTAYLQLSGFNITCITSVSLANYKYLLDYDLIILDVTNIVEEDMRRGGLELMKRIKSDNPRKPVIAASSKTYDPSLTEYFKLSDKQIQTPIKDQKIELALTETLEKFYSPNSIAREIDNFLTGKGLKQDQKSKVLKLGFRYIDKGISEENLIKLCTKTTHALDAHKYKEMLDHLSEAI